MTIAIDRIEPDVARISLSGWRGRAVGYEVSAYVIRGVLVDTGFPGVRHEMLGAVRSLGIRGAIVTHAHEDHSGNTEALATAGLPLLMHPACESVLRVNRSIGFYRRIVWGRAPTLVSDLTAFDPAPLELLHTPGHTEDHVVVWDPERGIVAAGDLFLGVKVRVAHAHESPTALLASLRAVAALRPRLLLDAHRGTVPHPADALRAKINWIEETAGAILTLHRAGVVENEIRKRVLGAEPLVGWVSLGEYSKRSLVHSVIRENADS